MPATTYSHTVRIVACARCGAPLAARIEGGSFDCTYCGAQNRLAARDEKQDRVEANKPKTIAESVRFARLREQQGQGESMPQRLLDLTQFGELRPENVAPARRAWIAARAELERARSFPVSERLFFLTVLLVPHLNDREQRAVLETAVERLTDAGHRHVLRCMLSRRAARFGDREAAVDWLEPCDQRPLDLTMDTAFRYAAATLAAVARKPDEVLALLGSHPGDVPLAERDSLGCDLLRIDALAAVGQGDEATRRYERLWKTNGTQLEAELRRRWPMDLCRIPRRRLEARQLEREILRARTARKALRRSLFQHAFAVLFPTLVMAVVMGVVFAWVQRPLWPRLVPRAPFDSAMCSMVCRQCVPPVRVHDAPGLAGQWQCSVAATAPSRPSRTHPTIELQYMTTVAMGATVQFPFWMLFWLGVLFHAQRRRDRRNRILASRVEELLRRLNTLHRHLAAESARSLENTH